MCGFAGFFDERGRFYSEGREIVRKMSDRITHRGPDERGEFSERCFSVGFNRFGRREYISLALSRKIDLPLSSLSATVNPLKFLLVMAKDS